MSDKSAPETIGNRRVKQKLKAFIDFVEENKEHKFYVCSHDNPDPDSVASAWGIGRVLDFLGVQDVDIVYKGDVSHPQNRAMLNVLNIPLRKWPNGDSEYHNAKFVFVDCTGNQKNMTIPMKPDVVIDHHKAAPNKDSISIHDEIGACSSLVTDMILSLPPINHIDGEGQFYCFDTDVEGMRDLSTALALGIKTDTIDFRSETTTDDDVKAYRFLCRHISDDKFSKIVNYELPSYIFDAEEVAWKNRRQEAPNLISGLGFITATHGDCVPYLADKMMRLQGIQTVVIYAIVDNAVKASIRTNSSSLDCDDLCKDIFGDENSGAKHGIGGALVPFNVFDMKNMNEEDKDNLWNLVKAQIEGKFIKATQK